MDPTTIATVAGQIAGPLLARVLGADRSVDGVSDRDLGFVAFVAVELAELIGTRVERREAAPPETRGVDA
jgi:hypothetical protein